jgi:hypothetical protein
MIIVIKGQNLENGPTASLHVTSDRKLFLVERPEDGVVAFLSEQPTHRVAGISVLKNILSKLCQISGQFNL